MEEYVLKVLKKANRCLSLDEIIEKVEQRVIRDKAVERLSDEEKNSVKSIIDSLVNKYELLELGNGYKLLSKTSYHKGKLQILNNGNGKVIEDKSYTDKDGELRIVKNEYFVYKDNIRDAHDGDLVLVDVPYSTKKESNKIHKVLESTFEYAYGEVLKDERLGYYVKPIDKKLRNDFIVLDDKDVNDNQLVVGSRVKVHINRENNNSNFYTCTVLEKLEHRDEPTNDIYWEALKYGMDNDFSSESMEQVKNTPVKVLDTDRIGRSDYTNEETFTIDGVHTKDIDDALSCKKLPNGNFLLRVHIADVTHYVPLNSPLEKDAYRKGTSTYLGGRVIPMLPHELSNGICSLNPGEDRLAITCNMEIDKNGNIVDHSIVKSVIRSDKKMSYDKVNDILKNDIVPDDYKEFAQTLKLLERLSLILRKKRIKNGSVEFGVGDKELIYDDDYNMIGATEKINDVGENLIEEMMIAANETVDRHLSQRGYPCLHRVHGIPNLDRVEELIKLLNCIGYRFNDYDAEECVTNPKYMQRLANFISNTGDLSNALGGRLIRGMSKAKYSPINIGHYGLGKEYYCHFTSPIRRYPDYIIHTILKDYVLDDSRGRKIRQTDLIEIGDHTSKKERDSADAERAVFDIKCASFLQDHVGEDLNGTIVEVSEKGLRIKLDNYMEGSVRLKDLKEGSEIFTFEPETLSLISNRNVYHFGDRVNVKILKNNDVLPMNASESEKKDYKQRMLDRLDKIDNRNTYLKVNYKIENKENIKKKQL